MRICIIYSRENSKYNHDVSQNSGFDHALVSNSKIDHQHLNIFKIFGLAHHHNSQILPIKLCLLRVSNFLWTLHHFVLHIQIVPPALSSSAKTLIQSKHFETRVTISLSKTDSNSSPSPPKASTLSSVKVRTALGDSMHLRSMAQTDFVSEH